MENPNNPMGSRTRYLPTCSAMRMEKSYAFMYINTYTHALVPTEAETCQSPLSSMLARLAFGIDYAVAVQMSSRHPQVQGNNPLAEFMVTYIRFLH